MSVDPGHRLGGRYELQTLIAVGGMGEVWVAHDELLDRNVAVKVLREQFLGDEGFLQRFRTEARNTASLSHPGIAAMYDYGEDSGSGYLVMELVEGAPLSDLLARHGSIPADRAMTILAGTARALHAAHVTGMVHRDVKPGNILILPDGSVKITDFGISKLATAQALTAEGMVMGTAQYLAPEQAGGARATSASDLYSLGVVGYEMLVGYRPFTGSTALEIAMAHVDQTVPPLPTDLPQPATSLVMRLLSKDPTGRMRTGAAVARAAERIVPTLPQHPPLPVTPPWLADDGDLPRPASTDHVLVSRESGVISLHEDLPRRSDVRSSSRPDVDSPLTRRLSSHRDPHDPSREVDHNTGALSAPVETPSTDTHAIPSRRTTPATTRAEAHRPSLLRRIQRSLFTGPFEIPHWLVFVALAGVLVVFMLLGIAVAKSIWSPAISDDSISIIDRRPGGERIWSSHEIILLGSLGTNGAESLRISTELPPTATKEL